MKYIKEIGGLTPEEWESALAGTLELADQRGYKPTRNITCSTLSMKCCALGSLQAADLCTAFEDPCTGADESVKAIANGFDDGVKHHKNQWAAVGHNLAKIFVDKEG